MTEQLFNPTRTAERELILVLYPGQLALAALALLIAGMGWFYLATERPVRLTVNGQSLELRTHQQTLGALLAESGFKLTDADVIAPPLDTPLAQAERLQLWLAQPVEIEVDGRTLRILTQSASVADTLQALSIQLGRDDRLWYADGYLSPNALLAQLNPPPLDPRQARTPLRISVQRSVPVHISDDGVTSLSFTNAPTVRELLRENDVQLHPNDRISPDLNQTISAGLRILIERSKPLSIAVDGKTIEARTREPTIAKVLQAEGIRLQGKDYTRPPVNSPVYDHMQVQVVRVREDIVEEASPIPYAKLLQPDDNLEIDHQELRQRGQNGEHRKQIRVTFENGVEVKRAVEKEWDARQPVPQITAYGRKIVIRQLMTPSGPIQYWRLTRMYATSYSPSRSGVRPDHPHYGITYTSLRAGKGVAAVDKSVMQLMSEFYVPGYGIAIAGDIGGGVRGRMIDLGFDEENYESWHQWVDVYWLAPPPLPKDIRWILPNTPVERQK